MKETRIAHFSIGEDQPLAVIAGPCSIEGEEITMRAAEELCKIFTEVDIPWAFKSSYDKANRTSLTSYRGPGLDEGLRILEKVRDTFGIPVYTDIHTPEQAAPVAQVCAVLQIPAFLCRQTDLLVAAAKTGATIAIKKGQFMSPWDMGPSVNKVRAAGNDQVFVIDRGTSFGYNNLVSDMRGMTIIPEVADCPICFDATHSVQLPGGHGTHSGGQSEFVAPLAKAAVAAGANALFIEAHENPAEAKSDAGTQLNFEQLRALLPIVKEIHSVVNATLCSLER